MRLISGGQETYQGDKRFISGRQRDLYQGDKRFISGGQRDLYQGDMRLISGGQEIYIRGTRERRPLFQGTEKK